MDIKQRLDSIRLSDILFNSYRLELSNLIKLGNELSAQSRSIETVRNRIKKFDNERNTLSELINRLDNPLYQSIIRLHYFDNMSFKDIAIKLYYHQKTIVKYHKQAIEELNKLVC